MAYIKGFDVEWESLPAALENGEPADDDDDLPHVAAIPEVACVHWNFKDAASIPFGELAVPTKGPFHPHLIFAAKVASHTPSPDSVVTAFSQQFRAAVKNSSKENRRQSREFTIEELNYYGRLCNYYDRGEHDYTQWRFAQPDSLPWAELAEVPAVSSSSKILPENYALQF